MNKHGMVQEIADLGVERIELAKSAGNAQIGGANIPYEPKELASMVTLLRGYAPKRYLAIEGMSEGGWRFIGSAVAIPYVKPIGPKEPDIRKALRDKQMQPFDLISIDARGLSLSAEEIWKYIQGGKEVMVEFGKGAPTDYGPKKFKPGSIVIFNLSDPATKALYFQVRSMDNKLHQSKYAGMVKL